METLRAEIARAKEQARRSDAAALKTAEELKLGRLWWSSSHSIVDHLWPKEPSPDSYFGLVQQFLRVVSHINAIKKSACIEGARMALARVKTYWAEMEATDVVTRGPPGGQYSPEHYFEEVLEGARLIEAQCSKSTMF